GDTWSLQAAQPASITPFGVSCNQLVIDVSGLPWLGDSVTVVNHPQMMIGSLPLLLVGLSNTTSPLGPLPLSLGPALGNCVLNVDPAAVIPMGGPAFFSVVNLSFPLVPAFAGISVFVQGFNLYSQPTQQLVMMSTGVELRLGIR